MRIAVRNLILILAFVATGFNARPVFADVKTAAIIGDNMVLQQGIPAPLWGTAEPGEAVTVTFQEQKKTATADKDGNWKVSLDALKAGGPYEMTIAGKNTLAIKNILVGEVWVCSGQSNMEFGLNSAMNSKEEIAKADFPKIRLFTVQKAIAVEPRKDVIGKWVECSPATAGGFSAVGYFFGRDLHQALNVPVGLIHTSWGGTPAEAWTSKETLDAQFKPILERWNKSVENYPTTKANYEKQLAQWNEAAAKAKTEGKAAPKKPNGPQPPDQNANGAAQLYNAMLLPLAPFAIAGATWYQGETNAGRAYQYRKLLPAMITDWRRIWGQGDFPFLIVSLANFMNRKPEPADSAWAELREAQAMTLSLPKTGLALAIDIGDAKNIHPTNKQDVGHRLALAGESVAYGKDIVFSGPAYDSMQADGGKIKLKLKYVGGGLTIKDGDTLKGFSIAGDDKKFVWADAKIDGDSIVVSSDKVAAPVAVRYAWADNPECNLYNKAGLPAVPFRTDEWPGVTAKNE